jgi:hypothetical protein
MTPLKKQVHRLALTPLSRFYGPDSGKRLAVTLIPGNGSDIQDIISIRPARARGHRAEQMTVIDVYTYAMKCRLNKAVREKMAERKAAKDKYAREQKLARDIRKVNR